MFSKYAHARHCLYTHFISHFFMHKGKLSDFNLNVFFVIALPFIYYLIYYQLIIFLFILRRLQQLYLAKVVKLQMCFVDLEKAFDRVPRKVLEWALRKKTIPEGIIRSVMSLFEQRKTRVRVDSELEGEFEVNVEMHQRICAVTLSFISGCKCCL